MQTTTRKLLGLNLAAALLVACVGGCDDPQGVAGPIGDILPPPARNVQLQRLACDAGLSVAHRSRTSATLRNEANLVLLYSDPLGQALVNGRKLSDSGGIVAEEGTLWVPIELAVRIRSQLKAVRNGPPKPIQVARPSGAGRPGKRLGCVVLDPGHGGKDPGAISVLGFYEKTVVLAVAQMTVKELQARNIDARLTRSDDTFLELEDRPAVANRCKADLFVSVHADSIGNPSITGHTVYVSRSADSASLAVANDLSGRMCGAGIGSRGIRRADYRVLVHSACPAALVEIGYISNRWEAARINTQAHQLRIARAIAQGIEDYLKR